MMFNKRRLNAKMATQFLLMIQFSISATSGNFVAVVEDHSHLTLTNAYASITFYKDRVSGLAHAQIDALQVAGQPNLLRSGFV